MLPLASPYSGISCFLCEITSTVPVLSCPNAQKLGAWKRAYTKRAFRAQAGAGAIFSTWTRHKRGSAVARR